MHVNDVEISLILEIHAQLNKLNAISAKERTFYSSQSLTTTVKEVTSSAGVTLPSKEDLDNAILSAVISTDKTYWTANITVIVRQ